MCRVLAATCTSHHKEKHKITLKFIIGFDHLIFFMFQGGDALFISRILIGIP